MGWTVELRHLRYFVAVAEEGSFTLAAARRLHTAQPSLSRQIRDIEREVGAALFVRGARGVELTAAGRMFLDHARLSLAQADAAVQAARRAARPARPVFAVGFVTGHELDCIPAMMDVLRDELADVDVRIFSGFSVDLADDVQRGRLDMAFVRREPNPELDYRLVLRESLVAVLPGDHALAAAGAIDPRDLKGERFIGISPVPRILRGVVEDYLKQSGVRVRPHLEIDNFAMATSVVGATRGVALLPASIGLYLPRTVVSRSVTGEQPMIELMVGFHRANRSAVLGKVLARLDALADRIRGGLAAAV
jgi:LysR family hca operon transcriptional activator